MLATTVQGRALAILDFAETQKGVTKHLDESLRNRWTIKYAKTMKQNPMEDVKFQVFVDWISDVAKEGSYTGIKYSKPVLGLQDQRRQWGTKEGPVVNAKSQWDKERLEKGGPCVQECEHQQAVA